jgi:hypothetical protein
LQPEFGVAVNVNVGIGLWLSLKTAFEQSEDQVHCVAPEEPVPSS